MGLSVLPGVCSPLRRSATRASLFPRLSQKKRRGAGRCAYNVHVPGSEEIRDISIVINGEPRTVEPGTTLTGLLAGLDLPLDRVAIEHNRRIAAKTAWEATELHPGDQLEIVQFVGGG